jgi:hypothetical protein
MKARMKQERSTGFCHSSSGEETAGTVSLHGFHMVTTIRGASCDLAGVAGRAGQGTGRKARRIFESLPGGISPDQSGVYRREFQWGCVILGPATKMESGPWSLRRATAFPWRWIALRKARSYWVDPRTGESTRAGLCNRGTHSFTPPTGWEDALLLMVTGKEKRK